MDIHTDAKLTQMRSRPLIFLDLEMTGLCIQKHEILEIGALKTEPKKPFKKIDSLNIKVKPENLAGADKGALKIVGFSEDEWKEAVGLKEALGLLDKFAEDGVLVGYNVTQDWAMLDKAYFNLGRQDPFYYHRLDVMSMAYQKFFAKRSIKRFSLGQVCAYLNIDRSRSHRALDDAEITYQVFKKLFSLKS